MLLHLLQRILLSYLPKERNPFVFFRFGREKRKKLNENRAPYYAFVAYMFNSLRVFQCGAFERNEHVVPFFRHYVFDHQPIFFLSNEQKKGKINEKPKKATIAGKCLFVSYISFSGFVIGEKAHPCVQICFGKGSKTKLVGDYGARLPKPASSLLC